MTMDLPSIFSTDRPSPAPCEGCGTLLEPIAIRGKWLKPRRCQRCADEITPDIEPHDPYASRRKRCAGRQNAAQQHIATDGTLITPSFADEALPHQATVRAHLQGIVDETTRAGAYIGGTPGVGKTYLLKAFVNALVEKRRDVCMLNDQELTTLMRSSAKPGSSLDLADFLNDLSAVGVLVIDDFNPFPGRAGADADSDWRMTNLYEIVDRRYSAAKTTIVASNFGIDALARVSPKLASRMRHQAWMRTLLVGGPDLRG